MIQAFIMAILVAYHPLHGMKQVPFVGTMANGAPFQSVERCMNWMRKTGDDSAELWEDTIEKGPFVVMKYRTVCVDSSTEI